MNFHTLLIKCKDCRKDIPAGYQQDRQSFEVTNFPEQLEKCPNCGNVRNQFAHRWSVSEVFYGEKVENGKKVRLTIIDNFEQFKKDVEAIWLQVIERYEVEERKHFGKLITQLGDYNSFLGI